MLACIRLSKIIYDSEITPYAHFPIRFNGLRSSLRISLETFYGLKAGKKVVEHPSGVNRF